MLKIQKVFKICQTVQPWELYYILTDAEEGSSLTLGFIWEIAGLFYSKIFYYWAILTFNLS